ncbi:MAG TPA: dienelactone hydrolase family protein [Ohtaekwangia sp.]
MKNLILTLCLALCCKLLLAQDAITVCHTSSTDKFAVFASNKEFNAAHNSPRKYIHVSEEGGKMITYKCADGIPANAYLIEAKKKTDNWIFVIQEWWGLNDNIKREAEKLYKDLGNVNVIALDMYDGKVATDRDAAGKYMQEFKQERGDAIIKGAIAYAGATAKIGTIGWCFGGGQSLLASLHAGKQAAACVIYYGMPVDDVERLKTLNCDVLNIWPTQDQWINKEMTDKFSANMSEAGKKLIIKPYDAGHAFANPSNAMGTYNEAMAADAYKNTLEFFKARIK